MPHESLSLQAILAIVSLCITLLGMQRAAAEDLWLIPTPKELTRAEGTLSLVPDGRIFLPQPVEDPEFLAAQRLRDTIVSVTGLRYQLSRLGRDTQPLAGDIVLTVASHRSDSSIERESYTLTIGDNVAEVHGHGAEGLFYGLQTLTQIVRQSGSQLPKLSITDSPDYPNRGVHMDVSRGRVPKLETLKWVVDYLAAYKVNQFQLYVEHPFMFRFNPGIAHNPDGLTADEILELQKYCQDRRVLFIPSLQSFGHMAGVFSLPEYRHLADVELGNWEDLPWNPRMHGATIDVSNPEALAILKKMHDEYLPLYDAPFVNVSADETYDLGEGRTKELAEQRGKGRLYLDHIEWLNEMAKSYGKRMMFWGDIVKQHPTLVPEIPKDTILLNWGYSANADFESCKLFADAGLDFYVCPGTSGWRRVMNDVNNADLNIRRYADAGHRHGAIGLLNTDWGDHGNFNILAGSLHGFALGAAVAWNVNNTPDQEGFDAAWNHQLFGSADRAVIQSMRDQAIPNGTWVAFYWLLEPETGPARFYQIPAENADKLIAEGTKGVRLFEDMLARGIGERWIVEELLCASRFNILVGRRAHLRAEFDANAGAANPELARKLRDLADDTEALFPEFERLWRKSHKESDLGDIRKVIRAMLDESRAIADRLDG
jgi:hypothetical protein